MKIQAVVTLELQQEGLNSDELEELKEYIQIALLDYSDCYDPEHFLFDCIGSADIQLKKAKAK